MLLAAVGPPATAVQLQHSHKQPSEQPASVLSSDSQGRCYSDGKAASGGDIIKSHLLLPLLIMAAYPGSIPHKVSQPQQCERVSELSRIGGRECVEQQLLQASQSAGSHVHHMLLLNSSHHHTHSSQPRNLRAQVIHRHHICRHDRHVVTGNAGGPPWVHAGRRRGPAHACAETDA